MKKEIYLDNAATTFLNSQVKDAMIKVLDIYGNPSSSHFLGSESAKLIEESRIKVATLINASPEQIFFTSGGTESNNWVISKHKSNQKKRNVLTSKIEHHAILHVLKNKNNSYKVGVDQDGIIDLDEVEKNIPCNSLASIMMINNETGSIQPTKELVKIAHNYGVLFHTDAVQAIGKIDVNVKDLDVDFLSISAHKFHGPKGIGALYIKNSKDIESFICGGGQENSLRAGTENILAIVGMGVAAENAKPTKFQGQIIDLTLSLWDGIKDKIKDVKLNGDINKIIPGILNVCFSGIESKRLVIELSRIGICISSGSACSSDSVQPSHVLLAMGLDSYKAHSSVRFSLSKYSTQEEVNKILEVLPPIIVKLRSGL